MGIDAAIELIKQLRRLALHSSIVEKSECRSELSTEKDICRHGQVTDQIQFLMDNADPTRFRVASSMDDEGLPGEFDLTFVLGDDARQNLHQRTFASAILATQGVEFTQPHVETDRVQSGHGMKPLRHTIKPNQGHRHN